jgi:hypothetical protein
MEHGIEVKCTHFTVADELVLDRVPDLACDYVVLLGDVPKHTDDCVEDLGEDDCLHAIPGRVIDGRSVGGLLLGSLKGNHLVGDALL